MYSLERHIKTKTVLISFNSLIDFMYDYVLTGAKMPKQDPCKSCGESHPPPTGKKCRRMEQGEVLPINSTMVDEEIHEISVHPTPEHHSSSTTATESPRMAEHGKEAQPTVAKTASTTKSSKSLVDMHTKSVDKSVVHTARGMGAKPKVFTAAAVGGEPANQSMVTGKDHTSKYPDKLDHLISLVTRLDERVNKLEESREVSRASHSSNPSKSYHDAPVVPSVDALRSSVEAQRGAELKLRELKKKSSYAGNKDLYTSKLKPGRERTNDARQRRHVYWPQELVYPGVTHKRLKYDELTIDMFVEGYARAIRDEPEFDVQMCMVESLAKLMHTVTDTNWHTARGAFSVILTELEEGRLEWSSAEKIDSLLRLYTQKVAPMSISNTDSQPVNALVPVPCFNFNKAKCSALSDHVKNNRVLKHMCGYCWGTVKRAFPHAETDCQRKRRAETAPKTTSTD